MNDHPSLVIWNDCDSNYYFSLPADVASTHWVVLQSAAAGGTNAVRAVDCALFDQQSDDDEHIHYGLETGEWEEHEFQPKGSLGPFANVFYIVEL